MPTAGAVKTLGKLLSGMDIGSALACSQLGARLCNGAKTAHSRRIPTVYLSMMPVRVGRITPPPNTSTRLPDWQRGV